MKRTIGLLCALALCATLVPPISVAATDTGTVYAVLEVNSNLMEEAFNKPSTHSRTDNQQIEVSLNTEAATIEIGGALNTTLTGSVDEVMCDGGSIGYVGVYDGQLTDGTPIIADVVYNNDAVFVALTLGTLNDESFDLTFYGEFADSLKAISNKHAEDVAEYRESEAAIMPENDLIPTPYVEGETVYQGSASVYADASSEYEIGSLSFYSPEELRNQGVMSVYAKVNTNCAEVDSYLVNEQGFEDSIIVYPDTFNISIIGANDNLHAIANTYLPEDGSTSADLTLPVYAGSVIGLQFITFPIIMSSTEITTSRFSSTSPYSNNKVSWEIYRRQGWNATDTDGDAGSKAGMVASADFTYGGNVSSYVYRNMKAQASIRYEYQYLYAGSSLTLHLSTDTMTVSQLLKILP